jgi:hypothetical protein
MQEQDKKHTEAMALKAKKFTIYFLLYHMLILALIAHSIKHF